MKYKMQETARCEINTEKTISKYFRISKIQCKDEGLGLSLEER